MWHVLLVPFSALWPALFYWASFLFWPQGPVGMDVLLVVSGQVLPGSLQLGTFELCRLLQCHAPCWIGPLIRAVSWLSVTGDLGCLGRSPAFGAWCNSGIGMYMPCGDSARDGHEHASLGGSLHDSVSVSDAACATVCLQELTLLPAPVSTASVSPRDWPVLGVTVYAPHYMPISFGVSASRGVDLSSLLQIIRDSDKLPATCLDVVVPIAHQRFPCSLGLLAFSSFLHQLSPPHSAVMLDLSRVGGHYHAASLPQGITLACLLQLISHLIWYRSEEVEVWVNDASLPASSGLLHTKTHLYLDVHGEQCHTVYVKRGISLTCRLDNADSRPDLFLPVAALAHDRRAEREHLPAPLLRLDGLPPEDQSPLAEEHAGHAEDEESSGDQTWSPTFLLFVPDMAPEVVKVTLEAPCSVDVALQAIADAADPERFRFFPQHFPVSPQPSQFWGSILALPAWASEEPVAVLDLLAVDGRCFATYLPNPFTRSQAVFAARLPAEYDVWVFAFEAFTPMLPRDRIDVVRGGKVTIRRPGAEHLVQGFSLRTMLFSPHSWDPDPILPTLSSTSRVCLIQDSGYDYFTQASAEEDLLYGARVASGLFGSASHFAVGQLTTPDVQCHGLPCAAICAITASGAADTATDDQFCVVLMDQRPLLEGWSLWDTPTRTLRHEELADVLETFAPAGWQVQILGAEIDQGLLQVSNGLVLVAEFVPVTSPEEEPVAEGPGGDSLDSSDSGSDSDSTQAGADDGHPHVPADATAQNSASSSGAVRERSRSRTREARAHIVPAASFFILEGRTHAERSHLAVLRAVSLELGGPWMPRLPVIFDAPFALDADSDDASASNAAGVRQIPCAVLKLDYVPERVTVALPLPSTQEELAHELQQCRAARIRDAFPILSPVLPQPVSGVAVFMASTAWHGSCGVCLDTSAFDNRMFIAFVPEYTTRGVLIRCADLPTGLEPHVRFGVEALPLADGLEVHLYPGALIQFLPGEEPVHRLP
ncbi:unnamed protein product, partial [Symbiodinium sp. CCMP2456]